MPPLEENFSQRSTKPEMDLDLPLTKLQVEAYSFSIHCQVGLLYGNNLKFRLEKVSLFFSLI